MDQRAQIQGTVQLDGASALNEGDAVRLAGSDGPRLEADASAGTEVLVWEMNAPSIN